MNKTQDEIIALIPFLLRYATAFTTTNTEDLVQETILKALSNLNSFQPGTNLRAWLVVIMRNIFFNDCRRDKIKRMSDFTEQEYYEARSGDNPEAALAAKESLKNIYTLPEDQRILLLTLAYEDISYQELSEIHGVPLGTVKSRLSRGRAKLKNMS